MSIFKNYFTMSPKIKAFLAAITMLLLTALVSYIVSLIFGEPIDRGSIANTFTFILAIEYFTDKYTRND